MYQEVEMAAKKSKGGSRFVSVLHGKRPVGAKLKPSTTVPLPSSTYMPSQVHLVDESKPLFQRASQTTQMLPLPAQAQPVQPLKVDCNLIVCVNSYASG